MIVPKEDMAEAVTMNPIQATGGFGTFERYLSVWVALCMMIGIGIGKLLPGVIAMVRGLEFVKGSQINAPIAILIWLMITPMMMKVDFTAIADVGRKPAGVPRVLLIRGNHASSSATEIALISLCPPLPPCPFPLLPLPLPCPLPLVLLLPLPEEDDDECRWP